MNRIYHTWDKWECYPAGFYEDKPPDNMTKEEAIQIYINLLTNIPLFESVLEKVINEWKYSCEHYLTNERMNRIAWLGQASLAYKYHIPSCFRVGFHKLTQEQQRKADESALKYLNIWLERNKNQIKIEIGEKMPFFKEVETNREKSNYKSPVYNIQSIPIEKIEANNYNPNHVAKREMDLLYQSIKIDGYTMPIVCFYDRSIDRYIIVDGYHRYSIMMLYKDIYDRENGRIPVSVIEKDINERMASTIRHNRARGKHEVELQASLVGFMKQGWKEGRIMEELGMTLDEIQRLLGIKGIASEIEGIPFSIEKQIIEVGEDIPNTDFE